MSNVHIDINGKKYGIGCDDGQEEHILKLARHFDNHVRNLSQNVGQIGDQRLFLMAALLIADEGNDLRQKLDRAEAELARLRDTKIHLENKSNSENEAVENAINEAADYFAAAAQKINILAQKLEPIAD